MATTALLDDASPAADAADQPARPTDSQRLASGLAQSVLGPLNVSRALAGLGLSTAGKVLGALYRLLRSAVSGPQVPDGAPLVTLGEDGPAKPKWRAPLLISVAIAAVLAIGGVAFKLLRTPSTPPVAPEPPRVRPASGATGDSAPVSADEIEGAESAGEGEAGEAVPAEDDPRKNGE